MTQGERVKAVRKKKELTLEAFGNKIGIKKSGLSLIENGRNELTEANLLSICREFHVNEVWLRTGEGGEDNMFTKVSEDDRYALNLGKLSKTENQMARNMLNAIAEASPEKLKHIEEFMKECLGLK
ncbi:Predicted transcriptional regulator [uncultured Blautia sp.]|nr:helix-turn-helix transcriptional regulator [uncultured Blautia sp.]SCH36156.1 Predicted transcriptional regulator [uncultured Blautia sp.]